jgi:pSer/pThr/pTyr-binding forkhead associated (FHA) protein
VVVEAFSDTIKKILGPGKEKKEKVGKAQFFIRHTEIPPAAQLELKNRQIPLGRVLGVGDELVVITPAQGIDHLVLGRGRRSDVLVCYKFTEKGLTEADLMMSRTHAAIQITFATAEIVDLNSKHGVFLGDRRVKQTGNLALEDEVRLGPRVTLKHTGVEKVRITEGQVRSAHKFVRTS